MKLSGLPCAHDEREVSILSVTPAVAGWGVATLVAGGDAHDLSLEPIAAWALVQHNSPICDCPPKMVVPLVAAGSELRPVMPVHGSRHVHRTILAPGLGPRLVRMAGQLHLLTSPGEWTPGDVTLEDDDPAIEKASSSPPATTADKAA